MMRHGENERFDSFLLAFFFDLFSNNFIAGWSEDRHSYRLQSSPHEYLMFEDGNLQRISEEEQNPCMKWAINDLHSLPRPDADGSIQIIDVDSIFFLMLKNVMCGDVLRSNIFYVVIIHTTQPKNYANSIRRSEEWSKEESRNEHERDKGAAAADTSLL